MAVMRSKDGKDLIVDCSCGCDEGLRIRVKSDDDGYAYLSYVSGHFNYNQDMSGWQIFKKKLKKIWRVIRNKDYVYSEICLTKAEFEEFKSYLAELD